MLLLTGFYVDADTRRAAELLECLRRNTANGLIEEIHLFVEDRLQTEFLLAAYPQLSASKIHLIRHGRRVTYHELFAYANRHLSDQRVIIANADIYFDRSLARLAGYDLAGRFLCLSRWDVQPDGSALFFDHPASQDAWIFQAPLPEFPADFHMGVPRCDNRLAWEAEHAGLELGNPGRSVRAYHLHLSQVRHAGARAWVPGPTTAVPADFLGAPWLWFVVPCMGRLDDVRRTAGSLLAQPRSSYVLVDYSCPDGAGDWARANYPDMVVASVGGRTRFRGAEARNQGAATVDDDGIVCFVDADVCVAEGFSEYVLSHLDPGTFLVPDRQGPGLDATLACRKSDFDRVDGFTHDQNHATRDRGAECLDLRSALRRSGLAERRFPSSMLVHGGHHGDTAHHFAPDGDRRPGSAAVTFRESMGYTIDRLVEGVSSHNNDPRPFTIIPEPLVGLSFTQVVASIVSPVEVEFLTTGSLYVLVGDDWDGYRTATDWLQRTAFKVDVPSVQTARGTGFEVWLLAGAAGERWMLPTQVMLVSQRLERQCHGA